ncbi:hypothetical protein [Mycobacterium kyorinense]|uniref:Uncharacterized protein n=1 Tax=Mycobacterium kyorinense TaxID=487514 RepID=A0A1X1XUP5_9MYCO|nr:hypothetical protein [Mycobacterium kyorinense]ORW02484.1 hypothetical protein AWC14_07045 [Mycobacterium kyorinense]
MCIRALHLIAEKSTEHPEYLEPIIGTMREYMERLVAQVGAEKLDTDAWPAIDPDELDEALRRFRGGDEGPT